jgi:hypothetical protein
MRAFEVTGVTIVFLSRRIVERIDARKLARSGTAALASPCNSQDMKRPLP